MSATSQPIGQTITDRPPQRKRTAFPPWAAGWFNAALLYGEFGEYEYAADRMKRYLLLVPDAPDAKAAREKMIVWEEKAKQ